MHASPRGTQEATRGILRSLFPPWLPGAFAVMFSRPMPGLSCQVGSRWTSRQAGMTMEECCWLALLCAAGRCSMPAGRLHLTTCRAAPPAVQLNAWATWLTCQWLMGECEVRGCCQVARLWVGNGAAVRRALTREVF